MSLPWAAVQNPGRRDQRTRRVARAPRLCLCCALSGSSGPPRVERGEEEGTCAGCLQRFCGALELGLEGKGESVDAVFSPLPAQFTARLWASSPHLVRGDCPPAQVTNAQGGGQLGNQEERSSLECGCRISKDTRGWRGEGRGLWQTRGPVPLLREQQLQPGWPRGRAERPQRDLLPRTRWRPGSPERSLPMKYQPRNRFTLKHPGGWTSSGRAA